MTRQDLSFFCTPFYAIAWALRLDLSTPNFPEELEGYIAWALTGIIAGLTPIIGPVLASGVQGALGSYKKVTDGVYKTTEDANVPKST